MSSAAHANASSPRAGLGLVICILASVLCAAFALNLNRAALPVLAAIAAASAAGCWFLRNRVNPKSAAHIGVAAGAIVFLCVLWNWGQQAEIAAGASGDIFRSALRWPHTPIYGHAQVMRPYWIVFPVLLLAFLVVFSSRHVELNDGQAFTLALALAVAYSLSVAVTPNEFPGNMGELAADADAFSSLGHLVVSHNELQPSLGFRAAHYPFGILAPFVAANSLGAPWLARLFFSLCGAATVPLCARIARELGADAVTTRWMLLSSPALCVTSALWADAMVMLLCSLATFAALAATKRSLVAWSLASGISLAGALLSSFSTVFFLPLVAVFGAGLALQRNLRWQKLAQVALIAAAGGALLLLGLRLAGFDILQCLQMSEQLAYGQTEWGGFDSPSRVALRAAGAVLAFLFFSGPALAAFAVVRSRTSRVEALRFALFGAVLVSACSGRVLLETERVWAFFLPALAIVSSTTIRERMDLESPSVRSLGVLSNALLAAFLLLFFDFRNG